jgi:FHA domain
MLSDQSAKYPLSPAPFSSMRRGVYSGPSGSSRRLLWHIFQWLLALASFTQVLSYPTFAAAATGSADPSGPDGEVATYAATIALIGVLFSAAVSAVIAWITSYNTTRLEQVKRQTELALQISQIISVRDTGVQTSAMRRFAVAIIKVLEPVGHKQQGLVYFIPMNSRITIGRDDDNDIVLKDEKNWLSRWHCGLIADQRNVWIDDYASTNGTEVHGKKIRESQLLKDGDKIQIGPYQLIFHLIRENSILSQ